MWLFYFVFILFKYGKKNGKVSVAALCFGFIQFHNSQIWFPAEPWGIFYTFEDAH